jgi:hypothetical protein
MSDFILAGMRVVTLTDLARFRLQSISFFIVILLLSAAAVQFAWNYLRRDFTRMPRITYGKSVVVMLWGLLFVIVLAMISGARELMTPGAWEKLPNGGYRLASQSPAAADDPDQPDARRYEQIQRLQVALWSYAAANDEAFPPPYDQSIAPPLWEVPGQNGARYIYFPGQRRGVNGNGHATPVAYEPGTPSNPRLVLLTDGRVQVMHFDEIQQLLLVATSGEGR